MRASHFLNSCFNAHLKECFVLLRDEQSNERQLADALDELWKLDAAEEEMIEMMERLDNRVEALRTEWLQLTAGAQGGPETVAEGECMAAVETNT